MVLRPHRIVDKILQLQLTPQFERLGLTTYKIYVRYTHSIKTEEIRVHR